MRLLILVIAGLATAFAGERMPVAQQNALVGKYCAVCHTDVARNGGLSLEHFDAAQVAPSLAAMMISKMTHGAMGAAGIPIPDKATINELIAALTAEASGAHEWSVERGPVVTASILRELPGAMFRLVVTCNSATHKGDIQLAWAPMPKIGNLTATVDQKTPLADDGEGHFYGSGRMALPLRTLTIHSDFPTGELEFPFSELPDQARQSLAVCFQ
ncbi:MAG TPA: hypothetical protein VGM43_13330 [Bryobacteraceae bacterium]|jgi:hypothetical protein